MRQWLREWWGAILVGAVVYVMLQAGSVGAAGGALRLHRTYKAPPGTLGIRPAYWIDAVCDEANGVMVYVVDSPTEGIPHVAAVAGGCSR